MRIEHSAEVDGTPRHAADDFSGGNDHARVYVAVAVEVLGSTVDDRIDTQRKRVLIDRRGKSVVDDGQNAVAFPKRSHFGQINAMQQRIRRRFDVDQPRLRSQGLGEVRHVRPPGKLHAEPRQFAADQPHTAAVEIVLEDGVIARFEISKEQGGDRRHARAEDKRPLALFERCQLAVDDLLVGRIEVTRVDVRVGRIRERVGRGSEDGAARAAGGLVQMRAGVNAEC